MATDQQHKQITVDYTTPRWDENPGISASTTMVEAQFDAGPMRTGERWFQCPVCLRTLPEGDIIWVNGGAYCPEDAEDVLIDENKRTNRRTI